MSNDMITFRTAGGTLWRVEVTKVNGPSNALIIFHHPDSHTHRKDRYAWLNWSGAPANDVTRSLSPNTVRGALNEKTLRELFTRSMLIGSGKAPSRSVA